MDLVPSNIITSGFSSTILQFKQNSYNIFDTAVLNKEDENSNYSFMVANLLLSGIFYVTHELLEYQGEKTGAISRWELIGDKFIKHEVFPSGGIAPTHLAFDPIHNHVYVANYGGSFSAFKVDPKDGKILERVYNEAFGPGSNAVPDRQKEAHPHAVNLFKDNIYVTDLGSDKIWHYKIDGNSVIRKVGSIDTPKGHGPRHMAIYEPLNMAYIIFELESLIAIYKIDPSSGNMVFDKPVPTMDVSENEVQYGAEIAIHPKKPILYVSNRGDGPLLVYDIKPNGHLRRKQVWLNPDVWPRHFSFSADGRFIYLVEQKLNKLQIWNVDNNGLVSLKAETASDNVPTFVTEV